MNILVTGAAGFIGASVVERLIADGITVTGADSINDYYDTSLKYARLSRLGFIQDDIEWDKAAISRQHRNLTFIRMDLADADKTRQLFINGEFDIVIHLAGQPGVRHSITHPREYIRNNIDVFINILEGCREAKVRHLVFASSSSVYGLNKKVPFNESDPTDQPASIYAATKKNNELMAYTYSHLYGLKATGLRFFTVYGPWGRPDMSPHLFINAILKGEAIKVFNSGDMLRDFTFIDDVVESIIRISYSEPLSHPCNPEDNTSSLHRQDNQHMPDDIPYRIFNVGNQNPVKLTDYIGIIEKAVGKTAFKQLLPMQPGDLHETYSDSSALYNAIGFIPATPLFEGISHTIDWFRSYYKI